METITETAPPKEQAPRHNQAASIGKNTLFGIISSAVQIVTRFVTVPIAVAHLGLGGFGIWSILLVASTYMRFGTIGIKSAFQKYVAEATGNGNYETASKLLSTGTLATLALSLLCLIPTAAFSRQIARASGVPPEFLRSAAWAITMLALIMILANGGSAYEAIVAGGHRIDILRKLSSVLSISEAVGIIGVLHFGYGLFAMAAVMAFSELVFVVVVYIASQRVLPQIQIIPKYVTKTVVPELFRFAGSYQLLSILQTVYGAIAPVAILRAYGPNPTGVLALANRLVSPVTMLQYAFVVPILSSSAMMYAAGSTQGMRNLLAKSFKVTLGMTLIPLGLMSAFGTYALILWTGETAPTLRVALLLTCLATLFQSFSVLGLVLYRSSGKAVMDNIREVLRILAIVPVVVFARQLGFYGVLGGIAAAELVGMAFMLFALAKTYDTFEPKTLFRDTFRMAAATAIIVAMGALVIHAWTPSLSNFRMAAGYKCLAITLSTLIIGYPALYLTGALSNTELKAIRSLLQNKVSAQ